MSELVRSLALGSTISPGILIGSMVSRYHYITGSQMGEITSKKNAAVFNAKLGGVRILLIPGQNFASAPEHSPVLMFFYGIISEQT